MYFIFTTIWLKFNVEITLEHYFQSDYNYTDLISIGTLTLAHARYRLVYVLYKEKRCKRKKKQAKKRKKRKRDLPSDVSVWRCDRMGCGAARNHLKKRKKKTCTSNQFMLWLAENADSLYSAIFLIIHLICISFLSCFFFFRLFILFVRFDFGDARKRYGSWTVIEMKRKASTPARLMNVLLYISNGALTHQLYLPISTQTSEKT